MTHNPRHKFDCAHCKFSWCCGAVCACVLKEAADPPPVRVGEVAAARHNTGYEGAAREILEEYPSDRAQSMFKSLTTEREQATV